MERRGGSPLPCHGCRLARTRSGGRVGEPPGTRIGAVIVGNVRFQVKLASLMTHCQWAWAFVISGSLLVQVLVAIIVLLIPRPTR